jgi:hypothetical protein
LQLSRTQHLTKSQQNEEFVKSIDVSRTIGIEWAITVKFYAALHYVQAYFASRSGRTPATHGRRATAIERDPLISGAYDDYRELEDISREARYDFSELRLDHLKLADDCLAAVKSVVNLHL